MDITRLEKAWKDYQEGRKTGSLTDWGLINLTSWMGERMGPVLAEIRRLREQAGTVEIYIKAGVVEAVEGLPLGWTTEIVEEDPQ